MTYAVKWTCLRCGTTNEITIEPDFDHGVAALAPAFDTHQEVAHPGESPQVSWSDETAA